MHSLLPDTEMAVNLLNIAMIQLFFAHQSFTKPSTIHCFYGNANIGPRGAVILTVHYHMELYPSFTFPVKRHGGNLFYCFRFWFLGSGGSAVLHVSSPWQHQ